MLPARLLRTSTMHALRRYRSNRFPRITSLTYPSTSRRNYCIPQPVQKHPTEAPMTSASKQARGDKQILQQSNPSNSPPSSGHDAQPASKVPKEKEPSADQKQNIPDIPSTSWSSIGFEEQDAKDPNKWKKFAWKYAGAVLLFLISYKTLHWYTDRLEADGKRRRKEMEEDREIAKEILSSSPSSTQAFPFVEPLKDAPQLSQTTSELDELYAYRAELQSRLQELQSQNKTSEIRTQTRETQAELKELENEIRLLEVQRGLS